MIDKTISHYEILEKLGEGGMGIVYKARDVRLDRLVALKLLPPFASEEERKRFEREAKTISALNHPNIAVLYDVGEAEGQQFIVLEYLPGGTLKHQIQSLHREQIIELAVQIAKGLAYAHKHQIIHRDIKPENILLAADGTAKIVDFGLARLQGRSGLTKAGSTVGTIAYMSPEQIQGLEADHRSDIWSYGVVLHEMFSGKRSFRGEHEAAIMYSILNEEPDMSKIPQEYQSIIRRALAKEPQKRYATAGELLSDLASVTSKATIAERTAESVVEQIPPMLRISLLYKLFHTRPVLYTLLAVGIALIQFFVLPNLLKQNPATDLGNYQSIFSSSGKDETEERELPIDAKASDNDMYRTMMTLMRSMKKTDELITLARSYVQMNPNNTAALLTLGFALESDKQNKEAAKTYEKAVELDPNNLDVQLALTRIYLMMKNYDESKKHIDAVMALDPKRPEIPSLLWKLGNGFASVQRFQEGLAMLQKSAEMRTEQPKKGK